MEHLLGLDVFTLLLKGLGNSVPRSVPPYNDLIFDSCLTVEHFFYRITPFSILNTFSHTSFRVTRLLPFTLNLRRSIITAFVLLLNFLNLVIFLRHRKLWIFKYSLNTVYLATSLAKLPFFPFLFICKIPRYRVLNLNIILIHYVLCLTPYYLLDSIYKEWWHRFTRTLKNLTPSLFLVGLFVVFDLRFV